MIYEETYQYLLHNVSSKEFDVCLYSLLHTDWDGIIQAPASVIAAKAGTKKKYLRQIIHKFTSFKRGNIYIPVETAEGTKYKFKRGLTRNLGFNNKTDRYCKKYSFFYEDSFQRLSINSKRLLLMAAYRMSVQKAESVMFDYHDIVPSKYTYGHPYFTKGRLYEAISELNNSELSKIVKVHLVSNIYTRKLAVSFEFKQGTLDEFASNYTERQLLRKKMFESGFHGYLNDSFCMEIESVGKYLYNSLFSNEKIMAKQGVISDAKDEILSLARFIYDAAIEQLAAVLPSNIHFLTEPKQASAYFSTIIYNVLLDEMGKYGHQAESIKSLLDNHYLHKTIVEKETGIDIMHIGIEDHVKPIKQRFEKAQHIYLVLKNWSENWVISRTKSIIEDSETLLTSNNEDKKQAIQQKRGWSDIESAKNQLQLLKEQSYEQINRLINQCLTYGNRAIDMSDRIQSLTTAKDSIASFFAIHTEKIFKTP
ncbi:hypothetical protein CEQ21_06915 [Niallia circulans]|uniref:Uncharacterized protein n=1 Tax=Niallia circulans TaxID=1397 RepID=A0A553SUF8_NIACI|nr:hypothetical protein [Niallia circulans]TRZ40623.1 hypothetical protein CEQ21_06915 [Niallia circulans]